MISSSEAGIEKNVSREAKPRRISRSQPPPKSPHLPSCNEMDLTPGEASSETPPRPKAFVVDKPPILRTAVWQHPPGLLQASPPQPKRPSSLLTQLRHAEEGLSAEGLLLPEPLTLPQPPLQPALAHGSCVDTSSTMPMVPLKPPQSPQSSGPEEKLPDGIVSCQPPQPLQSPSRAHLLGELVPPQPPQAQDTASLRFAGTGGEGVESASLSQIMNSQASANFCGSVTQLSPISLPQPPRPPTQLTWADGSQSTPHRRRSFVNLPRPPQAPQSRSSSVRSPPLALPPPPPGLLAPPPAPLQKRLPETSIQSPKLTSSQFSYVGAPSACARSRSEINESTMQPGTLECDKFRGLKDPTFHAADAGVAQCYSSRKEGNERLDGRLTELNLENLNDDQGGDDAQCIHIGVSQMPRGAAEMLKDRFYHEPPRSSSRPHSRSSRGTLGTSSTPGTPLQHRSSHVRQSPLQTAGLATLRPSHNVSRPTSGKETHKSISSVAPSPSSASSALQTSELITARSSCRNPLLTRSTSSGQEHNWRSQSPAVHVALSPASSNSLQRRADYQTSRPSLRPSLGQLAQVSAAAIHREKAVLGSAQAQKRLSASVPRHLANPN